MKNIPNISSFQKNRTAGICRKFSPFLLNPAKGADDGRP